MFSQINFIINTLLGAFFKFVVFYRPTNQPQLSLVFGSFKDET